MSLQSEYAALMGPKTATSTTVQTGSKNTAGDIIDSINRGMAIVLQDYYMKQMQIQQQANMEKFAKMYQTMGAEQSPPQAQPSAAPPVAMPMSGNPMMQQILQMLLESSKAMAPTTPWGANIGLSPYGRTP